MKAEWIVYGADKNSDAGWRVLGQSAGVKGKHQKVFLELCSDVLPADHAEVDDRLYFGARRQGRTFLCCGEQIGTDGFGRPGGGVFYGFLLPSDFRVTAPYRLTDRLREQCNYESSTEAIEFEEKRFEHPLVHPDGTNRWWKYATLTLAVCFVAGLSLWIMGRGEARGLRLEKEEYQQQLRQIDGRLKELYRKRDSLREIETENSKTFSDVIGGDNTLVKRVEIKIDSTTHEFSPEQSQNFIQFLSELLQEIDSVRMTAGIHR